MANYHEGFECVNCGSRECVSDGTYDRCRFCGTKFKRRAYGDDDEWNLRKARIERESANFDESLRVYNRIIEKTDAEAVLESAYWGRFLCEQYVIFYNGDDDSLIPSFWNINDRPCVQSPDYQKAMEYAANSGNAEVYAYMTDLIEEYKEKYRQVKRDMPNGAQIFICFKSGESNKLAQTIYNRLCKKYEVFYSEESLLTISQNDYEPYIYHSLVTARVMLLLCSSREDMESKWVYNEWSRFLKFCRRTNKIIIPIFLDGFQISTLPESLGRCEGLKEDAALISSLNERLQRIFSDGNTSDTAQRESRLQAEREAEEKRAKEKLEKQERREYAKRARLEKRNARRSYRAQQKAKGRATWMKLKRNSLGINVPAVLSVLIAAVVCAVWIPPARHWIIVAAIAAAYGFLWFRIRSRLEISFVLMLVLNLVLGIACIPMYSGSEVLRTYTVGFSIAIFITSLISIVMCIKEDPYEDGEKRVAVFSFIEGLILLSVSVGMYFDMNTRMTVIGCGVALAFVAIPFFVYITEEYAWIVGTVLSVLCGVVSIWFFLLTYPYAICALCMMIGVVVQFVLHLIVLHMMENSVDDELTVFSIVGIIISVIMLAIALGVFFGKMP